MTIECVDELTAAFVKEIPNYVGMVVLLALGWLVGMRITHHWNIKRTRHEFAINASKIFESLYGEFFAIWKLWNYYRRDVGVEDFPTDLRFNVMDRVSISEGKLESLLVGIACERLLETEDIRTLGMFRQGYQQLRESIIDDRALEWNSSIDPEYVEFKSLSPRVHELLVRETLTARLSANIAARQLTQITSNEWEADWNKLKVKT